MLDATSGALLHAYTFEMRLPDRQVEAHGFDLEHTENGFVRRFRLGASESTSFVSVDNGFAFGYLFTPEGETYAVESWDGESTIRKLDFSPGFACDGTLRIEMSEKVGRFRTISVLSRRRAVGVSSAVVNVGFVYTADALAGAGSEAALIAWLKSALLLFRTVAEDSGVYGLKLQFVGAAPAPFAAKNGDGREDIGQADRSPEIAAWRIAARADLVGVITESGGSVAFCPVEDSEFRPEYGFFTIPRRRPLAGYGFVHKLGHTFGLHHDAANVELDARDPRPYRRAYPNPNVPFQTVMGNYHDSTGMYYPIIPRFSNPALLYKGFATGTAMADNARGLREGMLLVERYHLQLP